MPTNADFLHEVPFFALLDDDERAALSARLDAVRAPKGTVLFHHGDPGGALYVIRTGRVELFLKNDVGDRIVLETVGPGEFFGEISLLDGGARSATALVQEDLEALVVDREDLNELFRLRPASALDILTATGKRLRETSRLLRHPAARDINEETEDRRTTVMKVADGIAEFSGSISFLIIHVALFAIWIVLNVRPLSATHLGGWDTYPFGLLTMVVSLEAIILSVFVLLSQNRQVSRDRVRNDIEYRVNLKAELEVAHLHEKVDQFHELVLARLAALERSGPR